MSGFRALVEHILNHKDTLIDENAYDDRENLMLALDEWSKILDEISDSVKDIDEIDLNDAVIDVNHFCLEVKDTKYTVMIIGDEEDQSYTGEFVRSNNLILINLLSIFGKDNLDYLINKEHGHLWIKSSIYEDLVYKKVVQSTFVHEFQHLLDNIKDRLSKSVFLKTGDKEVDLKNYWNSDHEKNAYYMQKIFEITGDLIKKFDKSLKEMTPDERLSFIKHEWKKNDNFLLFYEKLEPKAQKRLLSRIYSYFSSDLWK